MTALPLALACGVVFTVFAAPAVRAQGSPEPVASRSARLDGAALVVGVERLRAQAPPARHARTDAQVMARVATRTLGFPAPRVRLLTDERAGARDLEDGLAWLATNASQDGSVWVYFSGHGAVLDDGAAALVPWDADPLAPAQRALPLSRVVDALAAMPGREKVVLVDACFTAGGPRALFPEGARPLLPVAPLSAYERAGVVVLAASGRDGLAGASARGPHGRFTWHLMVGLRGAADQDADGVVTFAELASFVTRAVSAEARLAGQTQRPWSTLADLGDRPVVIEPGLGDRVESAHVVAPAPPPTVALGPEPASVLASESAPPPQAVALGPDPDLAPAPASADWQWGLETAMAFRGADPNHVGDDSLLGIARLAFREGAVGPFTFWLEGALGAGNLDRDPLPDGEPREDTFTFWLHALQSVRYPLWTRSAPSGWLPDDLASIDLGLGGFASGPDAGLLLRANVNLLWLIFGAAYAYGDIIGGSWTASGGVRFSL